MKKQLVVTIEEDLIPRWKAEAKSQGISLSNLIEKRMGQSKNPQKRFRELFEDTHDLAPELSVDEIKEQHLMNKYG